MRAPIPADEGHCALVVIPTVAHPDVLVPTVARICHDAEVGREAGRLPVALVLAVNSPDADSAAGAIAACRQVVSDLNRGGLAVDLHVHIEEGPIGFGAANNRGLMAALNRWGGVPPLTVFHNDDAHVPVGWVDGLLAVLHTEAVAGYSDVWDPTDPKSRRTPRPVGAYGRVGLVGPVSNLVAGIQQQRLEFTESGTVSWERDPDVDAFAAVVRKRHGNEAISADFLSGFCIGLGREALSDLMVVIDRGEVRHTGFVEEFGWWRHGTTAAAVEHSVTAPVLVGCWDEVAYPIAGYEDNDLCARAEIAGWRCVVASGTFVGHLGHQTFDRLFPEQQRGMRNRLSYYRAWRSHTNPSWPFRLVAVYRLRFEVGHDLHLMRSSLQRAAQLVDAVCILLTANPLEVRDDLRWDTEEKLLTPEDREFLAGCSGANAERVGLLLRAWAAAIVAATPGTRFSSDPVQAATDVSAEVWLKPFNEREERNRTIEMAEATGADWILSIDHDEVVENRITREQHIEPLLRHPDPLVRCWDQSWINHWDSPRLQREDRPWGDAGTYVGGMHGFRLWRVTRAADGSITPSPRRIFAGTANGLHCGNSPDHDLMAKRVSGIRFRHFGYVRSQDRERKHLRYAEQDPNPDAMLTGAKGKDGYGHIVHEEGMRLSPFVAVNGIGLHMLLYRGETADALASRLDQIRGVVDRVVLVWTDRWDDSDKDWLTAEDPDEVARAEARGSSVPLPYRPTRRALFMPGDRLTGPTSEMAYVADLFGCAWVHQPLGNDLAAARNAGLGALAMQKRGIGWSLFFDLDEVLPHGFTEVVALRRMAECSDAHGWMFKFVNFHRNQTPSRSESVRMARLLPEMQFAGRVHETFDAALAAINDRSDITVRVAPFEVHHYGLALNDEGMRKKLAKYQRKLLLEVEDDPHNGSAWTSLALHFLNDGRAEKALECLQRAVLCPGKGYLPFRELAMYHLRVGTTMLGEAVRRSSRGHEWRRATEPLYKMLREQVPEFPLLGRGPTDPPICPDVDLPPFVPPGLSAGVSYDEAADVIAEETSAFVE